MTVRIINADVLDGLRQLEDESVQCCVTSPPYFGLRDYGVEGQIGLEATPESFVAKLVDVFREVRRVLRSDGTLWLNIGDSYTSGGMGAGSGKQLTNVGAAMPPKKCPPGMKPKDLIGVPWMLAFALRADGWWLRQDIIWSKPNPMPESVTDRCTKAHEYIFHLSKSERYFWDQEAIKEKAAYPDGPNAPKSIASPYGQGFTRRGNQSWSAGASRSNPQQDSHGGLPSSDPSLRNKRSVWTIATVPYAEAHFATFPPELPELCIKAGTSKHGCCANCGAPWERQQERIDSGFNGSKYGERAVAATGGAASGGTAKSTLGSSNGKLTGKSATTGWAPTCACDAPVVPCTVLDPFGGAGTTGLVADRLQRNAVLIELNPEYAAMAERRINGDRGALLDLMEATAE